MDFESDTIPLTPKTTNLELLAWQINGFMKKQEKQDDALQFIRETMASLNNEVKNLKDNLKDNQKDTNVKLANVETAINKANKNNKIFVKVGGALLTVLGIISGLVGYSTGIIDISDLPKIKAAIEMYQNMDEENGVK